MNLNYKIKIKNDADIKIRLYYKYIMEKELLDVRVIDEKFIVIPKIIANSIIKDFKQICCYCSKEGKMMRCNRCYSAHYCSKECQKEDYNDHKNLCHIIAESVGDKKKIYCFNLTLCNVFVGAILENIDMPKKIKKKKFWKFLTDPRNGDYVFSLCDSEEVDNIIERNKINCPSFDIKNCKSVVSDLENRWCFRTKK